MSTFAPFDSGSTEMQMLETQEVFEQFIGRSPDLPPISGSTVIYFTAKWCSACRRIKIEEVIKACKDIRLMKCDVDLNNYTAGFCGIRTIPTFLAIKDMKIIGQLSSSDTEKIVGWVQQLFPAKK
jgi:thioredoxin-like negative regulator of GroEL